MQILHAALTADDSSPVSAAIQRVTGSRWSHAAIVITEGPDAPRSRLWECLDRTSTGRHVNGIRGPIPFAQVEQWQQWKPAARRFAVAAVPMSQEEIEHTEAEFRFAASMIEYDHFDLARLAAALASGWTLTRPQASRLKWQCAEAVARCLPLRIATTRLMLGEVTYDFIIPAGAGLPSIEAAFGPWRENQCPAF